MNEERTVELRKIPLAGFIDILQEIYDKGADYIDIVAKPDVIQDVISIVVKEEYIDAQSNQFTDDDELFLPLNDTPLFDMINPEDLA